MGISLRKTRAEVIAELTDTMPQTPPPPVEHSEMAALRVLVELQARQIEALRERVLSLELTRNPETWEEDWPTA